MLPVLTVAEMRETDRKIIEEIGLPLLVMMENAAHGVIENIEDWLTPESEILIYCGPGNNGGDGLVIARLLTEREYTNVFICRPLDDKLSPDAATQFLVLKQVIPSEKMLSLADADRMRPNIVIDALLGTGSKAILDSELTEAVRQIARYTMRGAKVVAVDLPTTLDADSGAFDPENAVIADRTVTIGAHKVGFFQRSAKNATGEIRVAGLGYPIDALSPKRPNVCLVTRDDIVARLPKANVVASKFTNGRVFALAGSRGMTGAAIMCGTSALRAGCGLVNVAVPESERSLVAQAMPELLTVGCSETEEGYPTDERYDVLEPHIDHADAIVLGPGLKRAKGATELMLRVITTVDKPMVVDAGGLAAIQHDPSILRQRKAPTIVTPHSGELSRLNGVEWSKVEEERLYYAREFAKEYRVIVVSKGAPTYTIDTDGSVYINSTGNAGLATAGSGDILAGVIAGTLVQMRDRALDAAMVGVYVHGLAGDIAAKDKTQIAMTAMDVNRHLPQTYKSLGCE